MVILNKRAQFFLLAAVIISAVVISLGITANKASVNKEPGNFYDYSYEVKREAGAVLDYEIYTNIQGGGIDNFVNLLAGDIRDKNPDANFMFLYGNNQSMVLRNYGSDDANVGSGQVSGSGSVTFNNICLSGQCQTIEQTINTYDDGAGIATLENVGDDVSIGVSGNNFSFPVSQYKQVIFIMQKDVGDESYITAK
jgi:hypothetical protein